MARPKVIDYDPASDETIVTAGVEGAEPQWIGFDINKQIIHIVCNEGTLSIGGDDIDTITRHGQQETLTGTDATDFYTTNKTAMDALIEAALTTWAIRRGKTGTVIIT